MNSNISTKNKEDTSNNIMNKWKIIRKIREDIKGWILIISMNKKDKILNPSCLNFMLWNLYL